MRTQLVAAVVMMAFDHCVLDGAVPPFGLAVGPGMVRLGESMLDLMPPAGAIEGMAAQARHESVTVLRQFCELDAVANWMPL